MILLKGDLLLTGRGYGPNVMFSDGENIGHVAASKDVSEFQFTQMQDKYGSKCSKIESWIWVAGF